MNNFKQMIGMQARKAFVAAFVAMIGVATLSASGVFDFKEILTIIGTGLATFQATYWTTNKDELDGDIDVVKQGDKKVFSLNLNSDPEDLEGKDKLVFKINKTS